MWFWIGLIGFLLIVILGTTAVMRRQGARPHRGSAEGSNDRASRLDHTRAGGDGWDDAGGYGETGGVLDGGGGD